MSWKKVADTRRTGAKGLKVVLKGNKEEIMLVSAKLTYLVAQAQTLFDSNDNHLSIGGYWGSDNSWVTIAQFNGGSWEYVVPLSD